MATTVLEHQSIQAQVNEQFVEKILPLLPRGSLLLGLSEDDTPVIVASGRIPYDSRRRFRLVLKKALEALENDNRLRIIA